MNRSICAALALALATVPAMPGPRYDRKLEQAAIRIVAAKIGDIRAGFAYDQKPRFVVAQDALLSREWVQPRAVAVSPAAPALR